jgi:flagellar biosynthesis protein FlhG
MSKPTEHPSTISFTRDDAAQIARLGARLLVLSGGRPGVGATLLAMKLAEVLASEALRVLLIDADLYRADIADQCQLTAAHGIHDVLRGQKSIHEVLQRGPAGIQIVPGAASVEARASATDRAIQRLIRQLPTLAKHADWLIVDAGNQPTALAARLWSVADDLLLVTAPDVVAVMDTYALIKTLISKHTPHRSVSLVVNQSPDDATALDVHRRIDQSCRRFLGLAVEFTACIPPMQRPGFANAISHLIDRLSDSTASVGPSHHRHAAA